MGRDNGKKKEPNLHKFFGGKPSIQILRHSNNYIDIVTKERYHKLLANKIDGLQIPTKEQEANDTNYADQVYESCVKFLISKSRDTTKFNLLFKENISYGFRRNLWGMKLWALLILLCCIGLHIYFATNYITVFDKYSQKEIGLLSFLLVTTLFWFFIVTRNWIRITSFAYAERLLETINEL